MFIRFDVIHERDGRTDGRTLHDSKDRAYASHRAVKIDILLFILCGIFIQIDYFLSHVRIAVLMCDIDIAILSVHPSVRLSHSGVVSKRLNISSYFLQHMAASTF